MGLKYIEPIKSIVLFVLVILSATLTFSIWTYRPNYEPVEKLKTVDIVMDDKKTTSEIIKPYKLIGFKDRAFYGTTETDKMEELYHSFKGAQLSDVSKISTKLTSHKLYDLMTEKESISLLYSDDLSLAIFQSVLPSVNKKVSGINFSHMIISLDHQKANKMPDEGVTVYFASKETKELYRGHLRLKKANLFVKEQLKDMKHFAPYDEYRTAKGNVFFAPHTAQKIASKQYFSKNVSAKIDEFKTALFTNPKIVKVSRDTEKNIDKYSDDRSVMTVYKNQYMLNFSNMIGEEETRISKTHLIANTMSFVNEHGGFTNDYRYERADYANQKVTYQLFMSGLPVEPSTAMTSTEIDVKWNNGKVATYARPYYELENIPTDEQQNLVQLQDAHYVLEKLQETTDENILDLRIGYHMSYEEKDNAAVIFNLTPSWFYKVDSDWKVVPARVGTIGGVERGLE